MASAGSGSGSGTTSVALLFSFSAVLFLFLLQLQAPAPGLAVADLLASALHRFLDGRVGLTELATRRNLILLCHAILFLILWDAGLLGRRRSISPTGEATTATAVVVGQTTAVPVPARPHAARSAVIVWRRRRPRNRAVVVAAPVHEHDAADRVVDCCWPAAQVVATWAAPVPTTGPPAQSAEEAAAAVASKQIVLVEAPRNDDDFLLDRAAVVEPIEHPAAIAEDGESGHRRSIVAVADNGEKRTDDAHPTAGMEMEMEMELADDRTFDEFIESQKRMMRQESLQLLRLSYQYQAMATCY